MNKKGSAFDIFVFIVLAFVGTFMLVGFVWMINLITDTLNAVPNEDVQNASAIVFEPSRSAFNFQMPTIALIIIIGMAVNIFISNFLIRANPIFFAVYVLITIGGIIASAYVSNAWQEQVLTNSLIGSTAQSFTGANFILEWLPYWVAVIGIIGGIFLFVGMLREREGGVIA